MEPQHPGQPQGYPDPYAGQAPPTVPAEPAQYQPAHAVQPGAEPTAAHPATYDPGYGGVAAPAADEASPAAAAATAGPGDGHGSNALLWGLVIVLVALVAALTVMFVVRGGRAPETTTSTSLVTTTRAATTTSTTVTTTTVTTVAPTPVAPPATAPPDTGVTPPDVAPDD